MNEKITINEASRMLAQGHQRMCGIIKSRNGQIDMLGVGPREPVLRLDMIINGEYYNEKTYKHQFIVYQTKGNKPSWAVVATEDWQEIVNTQDPGTDIKCIAFIDGIEYRNGDGKVTPLCFYVSINDKCNAVAIINNRETFKLWLAESEALRERFQFIEQSEEELEGELNDGREDALEELGNVGFYRY